MGRELIVAAVAGAVGCMLSIPPRRYLFWFSWHRAGLLIMLPFYWLLGAGTGGIGWAVAHLTHWSPWTGYWFLNGVTYGMLGQVILRSEWSPAGATSSSSLLGKSLQHVTAFMDHRVKSGIWSYISGLKTDEALGAFAFSLYGRYFKYNEEVGFPVEEATVREIRDRLLLMRSPDPQEHSEGRELLKSFCESVCLIMHVCRWDLTSSNEPEPKSVKISSRSISSGEHIAGP